VDYQEFIQSKRVVDQPTGLTEIPELNPKLFDFQRDIVKWALRRGRACVFADCGLGKSPIQLEWSRVVAAHTGRPVLILAPLAVSRQTEREGKKFGIDVTICREQSDVRPGVNVTNYEMFDHFTASEFSGVVLDESSILKNYMGVTKRTLIEQFERTLFKLCCTATPAPNDHMELGNHAEFLGSMGSNEMLARWFINDSMQAGNYRLKRHGARDFWHWVASWACALEKPSDFGDYDDTGYILPELRIVVKTVDAPPPPGMLFHTGETLSATEIHKVKRDTAGIRAKAAAEFVAADHAQCLVWCDTNYEADALDAEIIGAVDVRGSDSDAKKTESLFRFANGEERILVTKPSVAGYGMNFQNCHRAAFIGLSYSFEALYQAIRRIWRFGQTEPVDILIIESEAESGIRNVVERKIADHEKMKREMVAAMRGFQGTRNTALIDAPEPTKTSGNGWELWNGDCVDVIRRIPDNSLDFSTYSPPFSNLYIYSDSNRDMGNSANHEEFFEHFRFLIRELFRATVNGRLCSVHCKDLPAYKNRDGAAGLIDFPGMIVRAFEDEGWQYHSRVTIWKDPVTEMQRTKSHGLLHKQLCKDSTASRQGMADYLVVFRKWDGEEFPKPVHGPTPDVRFPIDEGYVGEDGPENVRSERDHSIQVWQRYASPVWFDIRQQNVLRRDGSREQEDEKHICLASGSLVLTREHGYIEIQKVENGNRVLTHRGRWMPVIAKRCNGIANTIRVCAQGVADLQATPDHKLWTKLAVGSHEKDSARKSDPVWSEAKDTLGSYLNLQLPPEESNVLTETEWWIVGRWLGDGHRGTRRTSGKRGKGLGQFIISCNHNEVDELRVRLGIHSGCSQVLTATQINLIGLRQEVREVLSRCGEGAENKHLPGEAVTLSKEKSEALLSGYLSADGHYVKKYDRLTASSVSRALLLGMAIVAQRARGVVASVYAGRPERIGFIEGRKVHMLREWIFAFRNSDGYKKSGWIDDSGAWKKVRKMEDAGNQEVWDLRVSEDSSFTAEGCIVHNCPLQLDVVERSIHLWTNPGDTVFSPFAGIGSEGFVAVKMGRKFIGIELKPSYFEQAVNNLRAAEDEKHELTLF